MRFIKLTILMALIMTAQTVYAGVTYPSQDNQVSFAQRFFDAQSKGTDAKRNFVNEVYQFGTEAEQEMWRNLDNGLTPDGSKKLSDAKRNELMEDYANKKNKPQGFNGDPNDPGPQDWSDSIIETDANGNVTGVKPRDWYERDTDGDGEVSADEQKAWDNKEQVKNMDQDGDGNASLDEIRAAEKEMDTDGDGKVSDEERKKWNDQKSNERKNGPGSPGNVPPIADWDKNGDGFPDKGYKRSCWQCCPGKEELDECHYGWPGDCTNGGSCSIAEICHEANEFHDDVEYECHQCEYISDQVDPCVEKGLYATASCNSECRPIDACAAVYIDRNTGDRRTSTVLRSDLVCYECLSEGEEEPKCTDGLLKGVCDGHMCESDEECKTVGDYCHACVKKPVECKEGFSYGECNEYACTSQQKCINDGKCHRCEDLPPPEDECEKAEMYSGGCTGVCDVYEGCEESVIKGQLCHQCYEREIIYSCPIGSFGTPNCDNQCDSNQECKGTNDLPKDFDTSIFAEGYEKGSFSDWKIEGCYTCVGSYIEEDDVCEKREMFSGGCPGSCSDDEECEDGLYEGVKCHECFDKDEYLCDEEDMYSDASCDGDCPREFCKSSTKLSYGGGSLTCYYCQETKIQLCEDGTLEGSCDAHSCQSDERCLAAGNNCHTCVKNEMLQSPCYYRQQQDGGCPGTCDSSSTCEEFKYDDGTCHWCKVKIEEESQCEDGGSPGACPGDCHGEVCIPVGNDCHTCREKRSCSDMDLIEFDECKTCIQSGGKCVGGGKDDDDTPCYHCVKDDDNQCQSGYMPGACNPYSCSSSETCVNSISGDKCHACMEMVETPCQHPYMMGSCTDNRCPAPYECVAAPGDMVACYWCKLNYTDPDACESAELYQGGCPGVCSDDENCEEQTIKNTRCHQCVEKDEQEDQCDDGFTKGVCAFGNPCGFGSYCEQGQNMCYRCVSVEIPPQECMYGEIPGACDGHSCSDDEECVQTNGPCHWCKKTRCEPPLLNSDECESCHAQGGKCWPIMTLASEIGNAPVCYRCDKPKSCEEYGEYSACTECYSNEICIPGHTIMAKGINGVERQFQCVQCMRPTKIEIEYRVYIIETPIGYFVLDKKLDKLKELAGQQMNVSSVMQLAQANSSGMDKLKGLIGGMGLDPMGFLGGGMGIDQLSSLLQQGLEDKRNKFGEDCFEDSFADQQMNDIPQQPPQGAADEDLKKKLDKEEKKRKKKGEEAEKPPVPLAQDGEWGTDPSQVLIPDAPSVACGDVDGEKALMVMDSAGNPVAKIFKETLENDPNAVMNAIQKAQSLSDQIQALREGGIKGIVNQIRQKAISKAQQKIKDMILGEDEEESSANPNDQFYDVDKKKKKKLLGFLGSSKPVVGNMLSGGGLRMGPKSSEEKHIDAADQWGIKYVGYLPYDNPASAWNIYDGSEKNVLVAVIDSGLDFTHKDGPQYIWTNPNEIPDNGIDDDQNGLIDDVHGWNFVDNNNDLTDLKGHGTHVAGIIAAQRNNKRGIAGINPGAVIMPIKAADENGETTSLHVYQAINYAVNNGAQVINISIGGRGKSKMVQAALNYAHEMGVFVAVASGNTGEYLGDVSPASAKYAFTVSAIDYDGEWSTISSVGPNNGLLAPGEEILSLRSVDSFHKRAVKDNIAKQYFRQSGTSFSTPMVTGTASLMLAKNPNLTPDQIADILMTTAKDMGDPGWDGQHGAGVLDAAAALKASQPSGLVMKITDVRINHDEKERLESVDVFATVRGDLKNFVVKLGKGEHTNRFEQITDSFTKQASNDWITRIPNDLLRGSSEWILMLSGTDSNGQEHTARVLLEL